MDTKKCEKIYDKLYENLNIVFNSKEILMQLSDENFKDLILNQVSILNFLENELPSSVLLKKSSKSKEAEPRNDAKNFLDKLNTILSSNKDFLNLNFTKESDIEDEVNYLSVYIKNTFKKDLSEFKKDTTNKPESVKAEFTDSNASNQNKNVSMGGNNAGIGAMPNNQRFNNSAFSNPFFGGNTNDPAYFQEQMFFQMAQQRLRQEISTGTFYLYVNKPKIVPILKKIMGSLTIIYVILSIIALIMCSVSSEKLLVSQPFVISLGYQPYGYAEGQNLPLSQLTSNSFISSILMQVIIIIIALFFAYQMLMPRKNENLKYSFSWMNIAFMILWIIFFISNTVTSFSQSYTCINYFYNDGYGINNGNNSSISTYAVSVYLQTAAYSILGLIVVLAVATAIMAPKRDYERMQLKVQEYVSEMKKASSQHV